MKKESLSLKRMIGSDLIKLLFTGASVAKSPIILQEHDTEIS
ncbi:hypothetical protein ACVNP0_09090 [Staphylococcus aureus]